MSMTVTIDGHTFHTAEGAESFYLDRRVTHAGDWDIWLINEEEYRLHLIIPPDEAEKNFFKLVMDSELIPSQEKEAEQECTNCLLYINKRTEENEPSQDEVSDQDDAENIAFYCALYDMENNMSRGKTMDELHDEYMSIPSQELIHQYEIKYEAKPLHHEEAPQRRRVRSHGARVRTKEE